MHHRARRLNREGRELPSDRDLELELAVGQQIEGYRWVEWKRDRFGIPPVDEPGRFVAHPGDPLAHLYVEAAPDTPLSPAAYAHLPPYSTGAAPALRAAERAGLFRGEGAVLSCTANGTWRISVEGAGINLEDDSLPRLLSRAALRIEGDPGHRSEH